MKYQERIRDLKEKVKELSVENTYLKEQLLRYIDVIKTLKERELNIAFALDKLLPLDEDYQRLVSDDGKYKIGNIEFESKQ